jgi:hypothetical protein
MEIGRGAPLDLLFVRLSFVFVFVSLSATLHGTAYAVSFSIALNTSSLSGTSAQLAFDLIDGDGVNNNTAVISGFTTNGMLGTASSSGGVTGTLPSPVTINESAFFNELLQKITLGNSIAFTRNPTTNFAGGIPKQQSVWSHV